VSRYCDTVDLYTVVADLSLIGCESVTMSTSACSTHVHWASQTPADQFEAHSVCDAYAGFGPTSWH